ncbi:MAG: RtcB family protein [Candidatus Peribacteraceae bacterium]|nr:RtcB family protein [Candidatus Peribacteraceae bacterium]
MANLEKLATLIPMNEIEIGAQQQIYNALKLDFLIKLAVMPDVHQGYSLPIGGVALLDGVISPSYVGYDIGCFVGNTKIPLLSGEEKTLKELSEYYDGFYVYSMDKDHNVVPGKAIAKKTRENSELMEVTLDNEEIIICTPDHKFMLRSGIYREAKDLSAGDSLMPLYRGYDEDGYESIFNNDNDINKNIRTHRMVYEYFNGHVGEVVHHKNHNRRDNSIDNLESMSIKEHGRYHGLERDTFRSDEFKKKRKKKLLETGFYDAKHLETKKKVAKDNITKYMNENPDGFKEVVKANAERGSKMFSERNSDPEMLKRQKLGRIFRVIDSCLEAGESLSKESYEIFRLQFYRYPTYIKAVEIVNSYGFETLEDFYDVEKEIRTPTYKMKNHKVVNVKKLENKEDVYCLTVDTYHNFALASGVFVHNCGMCCITTDIKARKLTTNQREKIYKKILDQIPVGFNTRKNSLDYREFKSAVGKRDLNNQVRDRLRIQLGTLGGGRMIASSPIN